MKRKLLTLTMLAAGIAASMAADFYVSPWYYNILDADAHTVAIVAPNSGTYSISSSTYMNAPTTALQSSGVTYDGVTYTIKAIGADAFKGVTATITTSNYYAPGINVNTEEIHDGAFIDCSVNYVLLGSSVTTVSSGAFKGNKVRFLRNSSTSFYVDETANNYGGVLMDANKTKIIAVPGAWYTSAMTSSAAKVTSYPADKWLSTVTEVEDYAFYGNQNLTSVGIGTNVTTLGAGAFAEMKQLTSLTIPSSVTAIAADAFEGTDGITSLTVNCGWSDGLADVVFDEAVYDRFLDNPEIWGCSEEDIAKFKANENWGRFFTQEEAEVTFQEGFWYFRVISGTDVEIISPEDYQAGLGAYSGTLSADSYNEVEATTTHDGVTYNIVAIGEGAFKDAVIGDNYYTMFGKTYYNSLNFFGVKTVKANAFENCTTYSVGFNAKPDYIDSTAFKNNKICYITSYGDLYKSGMLTGSDHERDIYKVTDDGNVLWAYAGKHRKTYPSGSPVTDDYLGDYDAIGDFALYGNPTLTEVVVGANSDTGTTSIGRESFANMAALERVYLYASMTQIGERAFAGSSNINYINCSATTPPDIAEDAFDEEVVTYIKENATITVPAASKAAYKAHPVWGKFFDADPLWILSNFNGKDFAANQGVRMDYDSENDVYTADINSPAGGSSFRFTTKLGTGTYDWQEDYTIGAPAGATCFVTDDNLGQPLTLYQAHDYENFFIGEGDYTFTVSLAEMTLTVTKQGEAPLPDDQQQGKLWYHAIGTGEVEIIPDPDGNAYTGIKNTDLVTSVTLSDGNSYAVVGIAAEAFLNATFGETYGASLPSSLRYIKSNAFTGASVGTGYNSLILPASLTECDGTAFIGNKLWAMRCNGASQVTDNYAISATATSGKTNSVNVVSNPEHTKIVAVPEITQFQMSGTNYVRTLTVPSEITVIGVSAFNGNDQLTSLTLNGVESIESEGLANMTKLETVVLPSTLATIGTDAFKGSTEITSLTVLAINPPEVDSDFDDAIYSRENVLTLAADADVAAYKAHPVWGKFFNQSEPVELEGVRFSEGHEYATWYGDTDLATPEGVTAYVVSAVSGDEATITAIDYIPALTGVLLHFDGGSDYPESVSAEQYDGVTQSVTSLLEGSLDGVTVDSSCYLLYADAFIRADAGTLAAHRCYLPMQGDAATAPMRLRLVADGTVTAITDVAATTSHVTYVSVTGRTGTKPFDGVNIVLTRHADGSTTVSKMVK